jgi:hypothetical protein
LKNREISKKKKFGKKRRKVCVMAALGPKVPLIPILERGSVFQVVRAARLLFW